MASEVAEVESVIQNGEVDMEAHGNDLGEIKELQDPSKPIRLVHKAKRFHRSNSGGDAPAKNGGGVSGIAVQKNSRKSRDGRGRGEPKKGLCSFVGQTYAMQYMHLYTLIRLSHLFSR